MLTYSSEDRTRVSDKMEGQSVASAWDADPQRILDSSRLNYDESMEVTLQQDSSYENCP